jgi:hypothetical protein
VKDRMHIGWVIAIWVGVSAGIILLTLLPHAIGLRREIWQREFQVALLASLSGRSVPTGISEKTLLLADRLALVVDPEEPGDSILAHMRALGLSRSPSAKALLALLERHPEALHSALFGILEPADTLEREWMQKKAGYSKEIWISAWVLVAIAVTAICLILARRDISLRDEANVFVGANEALIREKNDLWNRVHDTQRESGDLRLEIQRLRGELAEREEGDGESEEDISTTDEGGRPSEPN